MKKIVLISCLAMISASSFAFNPGASKICFVSAKAVPMSYFVLAPTFKNGTDNSAGTGVLDLRQGQHMVCLNPNQILHTGGKLGNYYRPWVKLGKATGHYCGKTVFQLKKHSLLPRIIPVSTCKSDN